MKTFILFLFLSSQVFAAGKVQQQGVKTLADCISGGSTAAQCLILTSQMYDSLSAMQLSALLSSAPKQTVLTSNGTPSGYVFYTASANATVGAVYTNNSNNFSVLQTISGSTLLFASGASAPLSSGTLTKTSGTGDATITFTVETPLTTFTLPYAVPFFHVQMVGGGDGGGSPSGSAGPGGDSFFGTNLLIAQGRVSGASTYIINSPAYGWGVGPGAGGGNWQNFGSVNGQSPGGIGGSSFFGGAGQPGSGSSGSVVNGSAAALNSGSGGGGSSSNGASSGGGGLGGQSGSYLDATVPSPSMSYYYAIGLGSAGHGGQGGNGADGRIIITLPY